METHGDVHRGSVPGVTGYQYHFKYNIIINVILCIMYIEINKKYIELRRQSPESRGRWERVHENKMAAAKQSTEK